MPFLKEIDELISQGRGDLARRIIGTAVTGKLTREERRGLASAARRTGQPNLALKLLHGVIHPPPRSPRRATDAETCEYAASLISLGAGAEASKRLEEVDARSAPQALLFRAMALFSRWEYGTAIPLLTRYVAEAPLGEYQLCIGMLNLAAALVADGQTREARATLEDLSARATDKGFARVRGNCLELSAQNEALRGDWRRAEKFARDGAAALATTGGFDLLFARKWLAVCRLALDKDEAPLAAVREEAARVHHWETIRDCDLFLGALRPDETLLHRVYFGTPHEGYRRRVFAQARRPLELPESFAWEFRRPKKSAPTLDVAAPGFTPILDKLFAALASDLYRPRRVATLHAELFPDEFFSFESSATRLHQLFKRLRGALADAKLPLGVARVAGGGYALEAAAPMRLVLHRKPAEPAALVRLRERFRDVEFTSGEAAKALALPRRSMQRFLQDEHARGALAREGAGPATRYRVKD